MDKKFSKAIMNPVRQRVIQLLVRKERATTKQMLEELADIPAASLYRHLRVLLEANCITVLEETKVRGTVEKTYGLVKNPIGEYSKDDMGELIQTSLLSLMGSFQSYFQKEEANPIEDMLALSTATLLLSDEELKDMLTEIGEVVKKVADNAYSPERKERRLSIILSPCEQD